MNDEKDILKDFERLKDNKQFGVPKDYFNNLTDNVMDRVKKESDPTIKLNFYQKAKPLLAFAASFTLLAIMAYVAYLIITPNRGLNENEIMAVLEAEIYHIDEEFLYNLATGTHANENTETIELTDEDIIEYLLDEGTDLELLINDN